MISHHIGEMLSLPETIYLANSAWYRGKRDEQTLRRWQCLDVQHWSL